MENRSLIFDNLDRGCFQETIIEIICGASEAQTQKCGGTRWWKGGLKSSAVSQKFLQNGWLD